MRVLVICTCYFLCLETTAQNKRDYQWIIGGYSSGEGIFLDFKKNPVNITFGQTGLVMEGSNTSMSDEDGNLLFSSNGCKIINAKGEVMENGDEINPGIIQNNYCSSASGSPYRQGVMAIPSPEADSIYYVFNLDMDQPYLFEPDFLGTAPRRLYFQKINTPGDSGFGTVVQKNEIAVLDTFARGFVAAVQHNNGRDWWIVVPKSHSNCYFMIPVTAEGVQPAQLKCSGKVWTDADSGGQVVFSPDGKKYIRFNSWNGLNIFDFDADTGDLSNPIHILFPNDTINYISGVAVSPNSRFLYVCARRKVYQFDLQASDIEASKILIAIWDGYQNPNSTIFYMAALAPDGKIYISNTSSTYNLHVINKPNCPGLSCDLVQHGIVLPAYNFATIPNLPHYRRSYLDCDSTLIGIKEVIQTQHSLTVFPNPASEVIYLSSEHVTEVVRVFDIAGRETLIKPTVSEGVMGLDVSLLPSGLYFIVLQANEVIWNGKFVKRK